MVVDPNGGLIVCGYFEGDICNNLEITNNLVIATYFTGYVAPGHNCGDYTDKTFKNNVAHSIYGTGAIIFPNFAKSI